MVQHPPISPQQHPAHPSARSPYPPIVSSTLAPEGW